MSTPLTQQALDVLLANLDCDRERAGERYERIRLHLIHIFEWRGCESAEDLADETMNRVARKTANGLVLPSNPYAYFCGAALHVFQEMIRLSQKHNAGATQKRRLTTPPVEKPNMVAPAPVSMQPIYSQTPPLEPLHHILQARFPVLYARVLEPTLADLRQEHSAALAKGCPLKVRRVLLQGYAALAAAAICQLGFSLLGRIAALWKARSSK